MENVIGALLQRIYFHKYELDSFRDLSAFQITVTTIHNHTLSKLRLFPRLAPLAKWGHSAKTDIYMLPIQDTLDVGINAGIVALPLNYKTGGLAVWSVLGHEVAGHGVIDGLINDFPDTLKIWKEKIEEKLGDFKTRGTHKRHEDLWIANKYWSHLDRIEEIASDVLGILVSGPTFGLSLLAYFRAKNEGKLRSSGSFHSTHPLDILRIFAVVQVIRLSSPISEWAVRIKEEILKDLEAIDFSSFNCEFPINKTKLGKRFSPKKNLNVSIDFIKKMGEIAGQVIATTNMECLQNRCLVDFVSWRSSDDKIVSIIKKTIGKEENINLPFEAYYASQIPQRKILVEALDVEPLLKSAKRHFDYLDLASNSLDKQNLPLSWGRHIVAAAILEFLEPSSKLEVIFKNMKEYLIESAEFVIHT